MRFSEVHAVGGGDEVEAPDFPAAVGTYGYMVRSGDVEDTQAGGEAAAPGEVGLPEVKGAGTGEVGKAVVGEVVFAAGKKHGRELRTQGREVVQMVGREDVFEPVDVMLGQ